MAGFFFSHLSRQWRNRHPRALALEDIAKVFKIRVAATDDGIAQLEGGDVGARVDLVGGVHCPWRGAMGLRVLDLECTGSALHRIGEALCALRREWHLYFEKVLWRSIDFLKGLLAGVWNGLHVGG